MIIRFITIAMLFVLPCMSQTFIEQGRFGEKGKAPGQFNNPLAIAVSRDGIVYVVDSGNHRIQLFTLRGEFLKSIGGFGFKEDQFDSPRDIWVNSLINIYVSDFNNRRIQRFDKDMNFISSFVNNEGEELDFQFGEISSCMVSTQNDLFILDYEEFKIIKFNRNGSAERSFGNFYSGPGELNGPEQVELLSFDKILVSDPESKSIIVFDLFGNYINTFKNEKFKYPRGIEVDSKNRIYIADPQAGKIFIKNNLQGPIDEIINKNGFQGPIDIAAYQNDNNVFLYILEGNEIIIGTLSYSETTSNK